MTRWLFGVAIAALISTSATAGSRTLSVAGTSNPFLAGMPAGSACCSGDSAPGESPVYAGKVAGGASITFSGVSGGVNFGGGVPTDGPNGEAGYRINTADYEGGATEINDIAGYLNAPVDALIGVFLNSSLPTANPAPSDLDFTTPTTTPGLQQVFFIGDGSLGAVTAPAGATRLFLGTVDGFGWNNNSGAIDVTVSGVGVPEPSAWTLMLAGFAGLGGALRSRRYLVGA